MTESLSFYYILQLFIIVLANLLLFLCYSSFLVLSKCFLTKMCLFTKTLNAVI